MELPIARESYQPSADALIRSVKRRDAIIGRVVAEETTSEVGILFANPDRPGVRMANIATDVRLVEGHDAADVVKEIHDHYQAQGGACLVMQGAETVWPTDLGSALEAGGYRGVTRHVLLLSSYRRPRVNEKLQIIPARSAYAQLRPFFVEQAKLEHEADEKLANDLAGAMVDRLDDTRVDLFIARIDGKVVGAAGSVSLGQMGVIEPAYTHPDYRGQGVAGTLMDHVVDQCQRSLFEQVLIDRSAECPSTPFYESLGFTHVGSYVKYVLSR